MTDHAGLDAVGEAAAACSNSEMWSDGVAVSQTEQLPGFTAQARGLWYTAECYFREQLLLSISLDCLLAF